MEPYSVFLIPGVFTVLILIISWLYIKNQSKFPSEMSSDSSKVAAEMYSNPVQKQDEMPDEKEQRQEEDTSELRAEVEPYLISPQDIQDVSDDFPLDSEQMDQEIKGKAMGNIHKYYKTSRLHIKEIEGKLSKEERDEERLAQRKQLEDIFKLMEKEKSKFGLDSMDQMEEQMKLYDIN